MAESMLFYIGTSKVKEVRKGGEVTQLSWGAKSKWLKFSRPDTSKKQIKYQKKKKNGYSKASSWAAGGVTRYGTAIPATAQRTVAGVERTCDVRYRMRKYTKYTRTAKQKKNKKCTRTIYTYYVYQLQYKDKLTVETEYSEYRDGIDYIYFTDHYYDDQGQAIPTTGHMDHPNSVSLVYADVRKNFEANANNNDARDNMGTYILANVRANVVTLNLTWQGLSADDGTDLLDTLNPARDTSGEYPYLVVQYYDPATGEAKNGTFFAGDRTVEKYPNGSFKEISVQLTEV